MIVQVSSAIPPAAISGAGHLRRGPRRRQAGHLANWPAASFSLVDLPCGKFKVVVGIESAPSRPIHMLLNNLSPSLDEIASFDSMTMSD